jgi:hypothetical protein
MTKSTISDRNVTDQVSGVCNGGQILGCKRGLWVPFFDQDVLSPYPITKLSDGPEYTEHYKLQKRSQIVHLSRKSSLDTRLLGLVKCLFSSTQNLNSTLFTAESQQLNASILFWLRMVCDF